MDVPLFFSQPAEAININIVPPFDAAQEHMNNIRVIQFAIKTDKPSGGALKVRHYYEHARALKNCETSLCMPAETPWGVHNSAENGSEEAREATAANRT